MCLSNLLAIGIIIPILLTPTLVLAATPYNTGFSHGVSDAAKANQGLGGSDWYITQPGKGFADHTQEFINGYIAGFCSLANSGQGSDADQATFSCK
jgi:hypothetical protein